MFEIGWTEMLVIAIVMIVVVGPKDLPRMLRTFGKTVSKLRGMAGDFQKQFNEALKEAELDDVKKSIDDIRGLNPVNDIKKQLNPFEKAAADVRAGLDQAMKPSTAAQPAAATAHAAEPIKTGAVNMPGVAAGVAVAAPPPDLVSSAPVPVSGPATPEPAAPKARASRRAAPAKAKAAPASKPAAKAVAKSTTPASKPRAAAKTSNGATNGATRPGTAK